MALGPLIGSRYRQGSALIASFVVALTACGTQSSTPLPSGGGDGSPSDGEGVTLTAAWTYTGTHDWSPRGSESDNEKVLGLISNSLVGINHETLQLEGELAESYELSEDGTTWTFHLRPDIQFHGGHGTLTAEDVKYTWGEHTHPDSVHGAREQLLQAVDGDLETNFEIVSDLEFRLHTTNPIVHLPAVICSCSSGMAIHSKAYADEVDDATERTHPIGTGPWEFVSSEPGVDVVLHRFDDYWGQMAPFENLVLEEIPDAAARLVQVQSGAVDIAELAPTLAGEAEASGIQILPVPDVNSAQMVLGGSYWGDFECCPLAEDSPWIQADDLEAGKAIREAMSLAIDRQLILDTILKGHGELSYGPLLQFNSDPNRVDPSWELPEFNLELAREKLAEGGYPDGFPVQVYIYEGGETDLPSITEAVAGMWEELGLQVERINADEDVLDNLLDIPETEGIAYIKLSAFSAEPALEIGRYLERRGRDRKYLHPSLEEGYEQISVEPDLDTRFEITRNIIAALKDDYIVITLFTTDMLFAGGPRIASWDPIPGLNTASRYESITLTDE